MNIPKRLIYFFLVAALLLSSCGQHQGIPMGALIPKGGDLASYGDACRNAYELATGDAREQGRTQLDIKEYDSKMDVTPSLAGYQSLKSQVYGFVEVAGSGAALAVSPEAAKDKVPLISAIDSSPTLTEGGGDYFFRVIPSDEHSTPTLSDWAIHRGATRGAIVFNQQNAWATGFKDAAVTAYRRSGGDLPDGSVIAVTSATKDFGGAIAALSRSNPQVWFVGLQKADAGLFVSQAVDKGITGPFVGVDNLEEPEFVQSAGAARTKAVFTSPEVVNSDAVRHFETEYQKRFGRKPGRLAYRAYDAYMVLLTAVEAVQRSGQPIDAQHMDAARQAIQMALKTAHVQGLTGLIEFDQYNDLKRASYDLMTYTPDGEMKRVQ